MTAIQVNPIHLAFGVMVIGMVFTFVFSKRTRGDMRRVADDFAFAFVKLSNYICPKKPQKKLLVKEEGGVISALPFNEQPGEIRSIIRRANDATPVKLFQEMVDAADRINKMSGLNRTKKEQFADPVNKILLMTHSFLNSCENMDNLKTPEDKEKFDSFLYNQVDHRMVLLKRINGMKGEEYRKLNSLYSAEMEEREQKEWQQRQTKTSK